MASEEAGPVSQGGQPASRPDVWKWARELNAERSISSVGGTPIAILGGFSLTNAVTAARECDGVWRDVAIACFGIAVTFLISALMFIIMATRYTSSPNERLEWGPEAKWDSQKMEDIRRFQRQDEWLLDKYFRRIELTTTAGIAGALLGMAALLISTHASWSVILTACLLCTCTVLAFLANFQWPMWLFPRPEQAPEPDLPPLTEQEWDSVRK